MKFIAPEWFLLVPVLLLAGWYWKGLGFGRPLRLLVLVLLVLILAHPFLPREGAGLDLWVLMDRSRSAADLMQARGAEVESLLARSRGPRDRLFYVDFAETAALRAEADAGYPAQRDAETRVALALQHALAHVAADRPARLLLVTDGFSTEPLDGLAERLRAQQVPLDYRLLRASDEADYRVAAFALPAQAQPGEPFLLDIRLAGEPDIGRLPYRIARNGQTLQEGETAIRDGRGVIRLADVMRRPGACLYEVELGTAGDPRPGNNQARQWIEIVGGPRMLLVTGYTDDPLAAALRAQGFEVDVVHESQALHVGHLAGARTVILNNVPAYRLPAEFLGAVDFFVREQGGGLLMVGGKYSFGSGGYFGSAVDGLMPVSMELRQEHRRLAVAMAIVLDRSGSMAMAAGGGRTKMDLANAGAATTLELLGDNDAITVFAVDSEAHSIVPLSRVGANRAKLADTIRRINSQGGGIYVYTGLRAAWQELKKADAGQRHVILFADAADAEEPGEYTVLLDEMTAAGATVSVIGLGRDTDSDAHFLMDVAYFGKGRIFFSDRPMDLPALFAQETVAVSRSAFQEAVTPLSAGAGWLELAARQLTWPDAVDGYNLSYLKPGATAAAISQDEYEAPLVAFWQRGIGRVAAVSFPLGGDFSERARGWSGYGDFAQTLGRWLMGEEVPPGMALVTGREGQTLTVQFHYDEEWTDKVARSAPRLVSQAGASGPAAFQAWERLRPGLYQARLRLPPAQWLRGVVQVGPVGLPFGPISVGLDAEWAMDARRLRELEEVSRLSGGQERVDLARIWEAPRVRRIMDFRLPLFQALWVAMLIEVLATRTGWRWPQRLLHRAGPARERGQPSEARPATRPAQSPPAAAPSIPAASAGPPSDDARRRRFHRAKRGR
jgi:uncharacterized membrane protein